MVGRDPEHARIDAVLMQLAQERGAGRTFCPSEAARRLWPDDWRAGMARVRAVAAEARAAGRLQAFQKGRPVDPQAARGPIRLGQAE